jgi:hypothetical protein
MRSCLNGTQDMKQGKPIYWLQISKDCSECCRSIDTTTSPFVWPPDQGIASRVYAQMSAQSLGDVVRAQLAATGTLD